MAVRDSGERSNVQALFEAANKLRGSVESSEYKHLVLGLLFLKYISDSFEQRRELLVAELADPATEEFIADPDELADELESRDSYAEARVFWVPESARWPAILAAASLPDVAKRIDDALSAIEQENKGLRNVLPRIYARAPLSAELMGSLVETIAKIGFGEDAGEARDILGRTYEYFIKEFARAEGHRGGEFFTPAPVARLLVEMLQPYEGRVLDPACGSCGLFVQSARFIEAHGGNPEKVSIYGQERNQATWRIGLMNLAIHGLSGKVQYTEGGSLLDDAFLSVKADYVMANPPFNQSEWSTPAILDDVRWKYGTPPTGNANYAWIQHFLHHLAPMGRAGFVMANGSLTTMSGGEGKIRESLVRDDVVDCVVALPAKLFYTTGIPVCLWFLDRNKASSSERDRREETLFIDARQMGSKINRTQIELTDEDIERIASTYHAWRGTSDADYNDEPGFCWNGDLKEIEAAGFTLSPGRYVGAPESEEDTVAFEERMATLVDKLAEEMAENERLAREARRALGKIGYVVCFPSDWQLRLVGDLIEQGHLIVGDGYRAKNSELRDEGLPFARAANIRDGFALDGADCLATENIPRAGTKISRPDDVVFTSKGTVGRFAFVHKDTPMFVYSPQLCFWRVMDHTTLDPRFLFLWMQSSECMRQFNSLKGQTDMADYISLRDQRTIQILLPPINEQNRIAAVLGALDDKLHSDRRLSLLLDETAATVFRARLVDFVGVDRFDEGETGRIPKGWRHGTLAGLGHFVNGKAFTKYANGRGRPIVRIKELKNGIGDDTLNSDIDAADDQLARHRDILFAWSGSLGVHRWSGAEALINQHIFKVIPEAYPAWFVYQWICQHMEKFRAIARDKATTMGHIQRHHLSDATVLLPDPSTMAAIDDLLDPLDRQSAAMSREIATHGEIRDTLLPRLISGKIRIPDTNDPEEVIGSVAEELTVSAP